MLKNKFVGKKIRNIIILLMIIAILLGIYRNIYKSRAEDVKEIRAVAVDNYGYLENEQFTLEAKQIEENRYEIELPDNINSKKVNQIIKVTLEEYVPEEVVTESGITENASIENTVTETPTEENLSENNTEQTETEETTTESTTQTSEITEEENTTTDNTTEPEAPVEEENTTTDNTIEPEAPVEEENTTTENVTDENNTIEIVENKIYLTEEQIENKQINIEVVYDIAILEEKEDGGYNKTLLIEKTEEERKQLEETIKLYNKILKYEDEENNKLVELKGYLPIDAEIQVEEVGQEQLAQIFGEKQDKIDIAYDIKIIQKVVTQIPADEADPSAEPQEIVEIVEINPEDYGEICEVTITDEKIKEEAEVYHVKEDNTYEQVNIKENTEGNVSFEAQSFSVYALSNDGIMTAAALTDATAPSYIPDGYSQVSGTTMDSGYVIQDSSGNQFVWIEVPRTEEVYPTAGTTVTSFSDTDFTNIEDDLKSYASVYNSNTLYGVEGDDVWGNALKGKFFNTETEYNTHKKKMLRSVYLNQGFYVGRYETGYKNNFNTPVIQQHSYPYRFDSDMDYNPAYGQEISEEFSSDGYIASLMYGIQWDLILKYLEETGSVTQSQILTDSSSWGNYLNGSYSINNSSAYYMSHDDGGWTSAKSFTKPADDYYILTTGSTSTFKKQNIYDLAGNVVELTLETAYNGAYNVERGGCAYYSGDEDQAVNRWNNTSTDDFTSGGWITGMRTVLYKDEPETEPPYWTVENIAVDAENDQVTMDIIGRDEGSGIARDSLSTEYITTFIDGEEFEVTETLEKQTTTDGTVKYKYTVSNLELPLMLPGADYKLYSGKFKIAITEETLADLAGNTSAEVESEEIDLDTVNPDIIYQYITGDIDQSTKTVKVVFSVRDRFFNSSTLAVEDLTIKVDGEEPDWTKATRQFTSITDITASVYGTSTVVGKQYTLEISGLDQEEITDGLYADYSGIVTIEIPEGKVTDVTGNSNEAVTITVGVDIDGYEPGTMDPGILPPGLEDSDTGTGESDTGSDSDSEETSESPHKSPYMPEGYSYLEGDLDSGYVIADSSGNEFVWIEVPRTEDVYSTAGVSITEFTDTDFTNIENDLKTYTSTYSNSSYEDSCSSTMLDNFYDSEYEFEQLKKKMLKSVYKNGGFYVGRYETGYKDDLWTPVIQQHAYPYEFETLEGYAWYGFEIADDFAENSEGYLSSMMFGVQWDLIMKYLEESGGATQSELKTNSTSWGNYYNGSYSIRNSRAKYSNNDTSWAWTSAGSFVKSSNSGTWLTSGASTAFARKNIYDLAGNLWELTLENYNENRLVARGGGYYDNDGHYPVADRWNMTESEFSEYSWTVGFRTVLYKDEGTGADSEITEPSYIPDGFTHVEGTTIENGYVVQDDSGNQFVWVEVPRTLNVYSTAGLNITQFTEDEYSLIETDLQVYTSAYSSIGYTDTYADSKGFTTEEEYNTQKKKMLKSIYKNGGFYIGRYETGTTSKRSAHSTSLSTPVVKQHVYPYRYITNAQAQSLSTQFASSLDGYTSSLLFGMQWNLTMKYLEEKGASQSELKTDSTDWGNYYNGKYWFLETEPSVSSGSSGSWVSLNSSTYDGYYEKSANAAALFTTGAHENWNKQNIYDLAGNLSEFTLEYRNSSYPYAVRGGNFYDSGSSYAASDPYGTSDSGVTNNGNIFGFRTSLYKDEGTDADDVIEPDDSEDSGGTGSVSPVETPPYIPEGFTYAEGSLAEGFVVEDSLGNQFVWVDVPKTSTVYPTAGLDIIAFTEEEINKIETDLNTYTSAYKDDDFIDENYDGTGLTDEQYKTLKTKMLTSIYTYGGFYVARYETGTTIARDENTTTLALPVIRQNVYPYNYITSSDAQLISNVFSPIGYESSLMFGVQWDLVLKYLETNETSEADLNSDSTSWGNYSNNSFTTNSNSRYWDSTSSSWISGTYEKSDSDTMLFTTGASDVLAKQGIYDIAGNVYEYTLEYSSDSTMPIAMRGGAYLSTGSYAPADSRGWMTLNTRSTSAGFRVSLFKEVPVIADVVDPIWQWSSDGGYTLDMTTGELTFTSELTGTDKYFKESTLTKDQIQVLIGGVEQTANKTLTGPTSITETRDGETVQVGVKYQFTTTITLTDIEQQLKQLAINIPADTLIDEFGNTSDALETTVDFSDVLESLQMRLDSVSGTAYTPNVYTNHNVYVYLEAISGKTSTYSITKNDESLVSGKETGTENATALTETGTYKVTVSSTDTTTGATITITYDVILIDKTLPYATSMEIKNVTKDGYDVYVYGIGDADSGFNEIIFKTWTTTDGEDDIKSSSESSTSATLQDEGSGTWKYSVSVSDHSNQEGYYNTKAFIYDNAGNIYEIQDTTYVDRSSPTITVSPESKTWTNSAVSTTITVADDYSGLASNSYQYFLSTSSTELSDGTWTDYTSGTAFSLNPGTSGTYYLFVKTVTDNHGNISSTNGTIQDVSGTNYHSFGAYQFDYDIPTATGITFDTIYTKTGQVTATATGVTDVGGSGVKNVAWYVKDPSGTTIMSDVASDGEWYKDIDVSSYSEGKYTVAIVLTDNAGNTNDTTISTSPSIIGWKEFWYDKTNPTITVSPTSNTWTNSAVSTTITVADDNSGLASNSYQYFLSTSSTELSGGTWTDYTSGTEFSLNPGTSGTYYLFVKTVTDNAGNVSSTDGTIQAVSGTNYHRFGEYQFDYDQPTWTYVSKDIYYTTVNDAGNDDYANKERTVKITFKGTDATSKITSSLTKDNITVKVNGTDVTSGITKTLTTNSTADKEIQYTLTITGITGDGTLAVELPSGTLTDQAGNTSNVSNIVGSANITIDNTNPNLTLAVTSPTAGNYKADQVITITATYNENVYKEITSNTLIDTTSEAPAMVLTFGGADAKNTVTCTAVSENVFTYSYTIKAPTTTTGYDGDNGTLVIKSLETVYDRAGNSISASDITPSVNIVADTIVPTITSITSNVTSPTNADSIIYTIVFSETVTGFAAEDITVNSGKGTVTSLTGSGTTYTAVVSTTDNTEYTESITIADGKCIDKAGNGNVENTSTGIVVDRIEPTLTITADKTTPTNASSITYTFTFSEEVTGFTTDDITLTATQNQATKGTFTAVSSTVYTLVVNTVDEIEENVTVSVEENKCVDKAQNPNVAASSTSIVVDRIEPTLTITADKTTPTNASSITYTFTFDEEVTGFTTDDITLTATQNQATKGTFTAVSSTVYTLVVNTVDEIEETVTVSVEANKCVDKAQNPNVAATSTAIVVDRIDPTIISITSNVTSPTNASSITYTIVFSETVTGFETEDITVNSGKGAVTSFSGSGTTYTAVVSTTDNVAYTETITIAEGKCVDKAGNGNVAKTSSEIEVDRADPTISVSPEKTTNSSASDYVKSVSVTITATDPAGAGLSTSNSYQYYLSTNATTPTDGSWTDYTSGTAFTLGEGKTGTFYLFVKPVSDKAGNISSTNDYHIYGTYKFDNTAPTYLGYDAFYSGDNSSYTSGTWTNDANGAVHTTISAGDSHSGIASIQYKEDSESSWTTFSFSQGELTQSGTTWSGIESWELIDRDDNYYFKIVDNVGNEYVTTSTVWNIRYDMTEPIAGTLQMGYSSGANDYTDSSWSRQNVYIEVVNGQDTGTFQSGHSSTIFNYTLTKGDGTTTTSSGTSATLTEEGTYEITVTTTDVAGNSTTNPTTYTVKIDKTAPTNLTYTTSYSDETGSYTSGDWYNGSKGSVHTTLSASDSVSGIASIQYKKVGTETWTTFSFSVSALTQSGTTWTGTENWNLIERNDSYDFKAVDVAGNETEISGTPDFIVRYDLTKPFWSTENINIDSTNKQITVDLIGTDAYSGFASDTLDTGDITVTVDGETASSVTKNLSSATYYKSDETITTDVTEAVKVKYTLTLSGFEQSKTLQDGKNYKEWSGNVAIVVAEDTLEDKATNKNIQTPFTLGFADFIKPQVIYRYDTTDINYSTKEVKLVFDVTDKYYKEGTLSLSDLVIKIDGVDITNVAAVTKTFPTPTEVTATVNGTSKTIGHTYTLTLKELTQDGTNYLNYSGVVTVEIAEGKVKDKGPNGDDTNLNGNSAQTITMGIDLPEEDGSGVVADVVNPIWKTQNFQIDKTNSKVTVDIIGTDKYLDVANSGLEIGDITVIVDGETASSVTKELSTATALKEDRDGDGTEESQYGIKYTLTLSGWPQSTLQSGKIFKEWSGTTKITIAANTLVDNSSNKNIEDTYTLGLVDFIKPVIEKVSATNTTGKQTIVFNVIDKYLDITDQVSTDEIIVYIDGVEVSGITKTITSITNLSATVNSASKTVGQQYTLELTNFTQDDWTGTVSIAIKASSVYDTSDNPNDLTTITGLHKDEIKPVIQKVSSTPNASAGTETIVLNVLDKYLDTSDPLEDTEITVYIDGEEARNITKTLTKIDDMKETVNGDSSHIVGQQYQLVLSDFEKIRNDKGYKDWSGTISIEIVAGAVKDSVKDGAGGNTNDLTTLTGDFIDFIKPDLKYTHQSTDINTGTKRYIMTFDITDKYYTSGVLEEADLNIYMRNGQKDASGNEIVYNLKNEPVSISLSATEKNATFKKTVSGTVETTATSHVIGHTYTLTISDLEQLEIKSGLTTLDYSGIITVEVAADQVVDTSSNKNTATTITSGISIENGVLSGTATEVDVVDPIWERISSSADAMQQTATIKFKGTDTYYVADSVVATDNIKVYVNGVEVTDLATAGITKTLVSTIKLTEERLVNGVNTTVQYGAEYEVTITGFATDVNQVKIRLPKGAIVDQNGNDSEVTDLIVYNVLKSAATEVSETSEFLGESVGTTIYPEGVTSVTPIQRQNIEQVIFVNSTEGSEVSEVQKIWDVSAQGDDSIIAWTSNTTAPYTVYIGSDYEIFANQNSSFLFSYIGSATNSTAQETIKDLNILNVYSVTDMSYMFNYCGSQAMISLVLGTNFDTSDVTYMTGMFQMCGATAMQTLDLGDNFDTKNVVDMSYMFNQTGTNAMTTFDLGEKFDTSNVQFMDGMFAWCGEVALQTLNLGSLFDTSNVLSMNRMFLATGYTAMTSLSLGSLFDTSNVSEMSEMFALCGYTAMTSLNLGDEFDTSQVTNMYSMFNECGATKLVTLNLGNKFDTKQVTNMAYMFWGCGSATMTSLDLGPAFVKIPDGTITDNEGNVVSAHRKIFDNCGKEGNLTVYAPEAIYSSQSAFKLNSTDTTTVITPNTGDVDEETSVSRGTTIIPQYKPEWTKVSSVLDTDNKKLTVTVTGSAYSTAKDYASNVTSTLANEDITVYVNGVEVTSTTNPTVTVSTGSQSTNATSGKTEVTHTIELKNLEEAARSASIPYKELSGNISIRIGGRGKETSTYTANVLTDSYGNQSMMQMDEGQTAGTWINVTFEDTETDRNTNGIMFADFIKPEITYLSSQTTVDNDNKILTVVFSAVDRYFDGTNSSLDLSDLTFVVDGETVDINVTGNTLTKDTVDVTDADGNGIGSKYTLVVKNLQKYEGTANDGFSYSGIVGISIPENKFKDLSGNVNDATTITVGVDETDGNVNTEVDENGDIVDVVDPIWELGEVNLATGTIKLKAIDKYFKQCTVDEDAITVIVNGVSSTTVVKDITTITPTDIKQTVSGVENTLVGKEYTLQLSNITPEEGTEGNYITFTPTETIVGGTAQYKAENGGDVSIKIAAGTIEDNSGNKNIEYTFDVGNIDNTQPEVYDVQKTQDASGNKETFIFNITDRNYDPSDLVTIEGTSEITVWIDGVQLTAIPKPTTIAEQEANSDKIWMELSYIPIKLDIDGVTGKILGHQYTLVLSNIAETTKRSGKDYLEWSGTLEVKIASNAAKDLKQNTLNTATTTITDYVDYIKPQVEKVTVTDPVDETNKQYTISFNVIDKYLDTSNMVTTSEITVYVDGETATAIAKPTTAADQETHKDKIWMELTSTQITATMNKTVSGTVISGTYTIGHTYTLVLSNFEQSTKQTGKNFMEWSGTVSIEIAQDAVNDINGMTNVANNTLDTEVANRTVSGDHVDFIKPVVEKVSSSNDATAKTETIYFNVIDKYLDTTDLVTDGEITVYIDGEVSDVTKTLTRVTANDVTATVNEASRTVSHQYKLVLSDFEQSSRNAGDYTDWSGTVTIEIAQNAVKDTSLNTLDADSAERTIEGDFVDFIKPNLKYTHSISNIDLTNKKYTMTFDITDKYYSSGELSLSDLTITMQNGQYQRDANGDYILDGNSNKQPIVYNLMDLADSGEIDIDDSSFTSEEKSATFRKTVSGAVEETATSHVIGHTYTLTIKGLEQIARKAGLTTLDYSGVITVEVAADKIVDISNNKNDVTYVTSGVNIENGTESGTATEVDVVDPIWERVSSSADAIGKTGTITLKGTDTYFDSDDTDASTLTSDEIEIYINGEKDTTLTPTISTETELIEDRIVNGVATSGVQYGVQYTITITGFDTGVNQVKVRILEDAIKDDSGNGNKETDLIVYNVLKTTVSETAETSAFLGESVATTVYPEGVTSVTPISRQDIEQIVFVNSLEDLIDGAVPDIWDTTAKDWTIKDGIQRVWDVSAQGDDSILAWTSQTTAPYTVYIGSNWEMFANQSSNYLFSYIGYAESCTETEVVKSLSLLNENYVTNMENMFYNFGYRSMTSLDLEEFNTSNVQIMKGMFSGCGNLAMTSLDLGTQFDTSKVTNMNAMFNNCGEYSMTEIRMGTSTNIIEFNTANVENMSMMFMEFGYKLANLAFTTAFDTSKVTNMACMFYKCGYTSLTSLTLPTSFNTANVINMNMMFGETGFTAMTSLDLGDDFDTSKVTDMSFMFYQCGATAMTSLDLGDLFYTNMVTDMRFMLYGCGDTTMTVLDLGPAFTHIPEETITINSIDYTPYEGMFDDCGKEGNLTIYAPESIYSDNATFKFN